MPVRCPVTPNHVLVQIAPDLYQCPDCGAGPVDFWAVSNVDLDGDVVGGLYATWRPELECYVLSVVSWSVDATGRRLPSSLSSTLFGYASSVAELAEAPLPARSPSQEVVRLREGMFSSPLGEKLVPTGGRSGRSATAPSPAGSSGSSPRRRKRARA